MENFDNIIEIMIRQHRTLQKDLGGALVLSEVKNNPDTEEIDNNLRQFKIDLGEHLQLENSIFYPELLKIMKEKGVDTLKTEDFISQMKAIGEVVMTFLSKYKDAQVIGNQFEDFKREIVGIISALNLRIESEESGVYGYWGIYK
jgi:hypothetical protein